MTFPYGFFYTIGALFAFVVPAFVLTGGAPPGVTFTCAAFGIGVLTLTHILAKHDPERQEPEPQPDYGAVRVVPYGVAQFKVERYEIDDADSKRNHARAYWRSQGEPFPSYEAAEEHALMILRKHRAAEEVHDALNRQREAHRAAHPPRIITLKDEEALSG